MKITDLLNPTEPTPEVVETPATPEPQPEPEQVDEAKRVFRQKGGKIVKAFRCTAGKRKGKAVANPADCFKKKDLVKARKARISSKKTKFKRARKTKITLRKAAHKKVVQLNKSKNKK